MAGKETLIFIRASLNISNMLVYEVPKDKELFSKSWVTRKMSLQILFEVTLYFHR